MERFWCRTRRSTSRQPISILRRVRRLCRFWKLKDTCGIAAAGLWRSRLFRCDYGNACVTAVAPDTRPDEDLSVSEIDLLLKRGLWMHKRDLQLGQTQAPIYLPNASQGQTGALSLPRLLPPPRRLCSLCRGVGTISRIARISFCRHRRERSYQGARWLVFRRRPKIFQGTGPTASRGYRVFRTSPFRGLTNVVFDKTGWSRRFDDQNSWPRSFSKRVANDHFKAASRLLKKSLALGDEA
jgi:hypothetical protein